MFANSIILLDKADMPNMAQFEETKSGSLNEVFSDPA